MQPVPDEDQSVSAEAGWGEARGQAAGWDSCGGHLEVNYLSEVSRAELLEC